MRGQRGEGCQAGLEGGQGSVWLRGRRGDREWAPHQHVTGVFGLGGGGEGDEKADLSVRQHRQLWFYGSVAWSLILCANRAAGLIPGRGTCPGCGFDLQPGARVGSN